MLAIILLSAALLVLVTAGAILAFTRKKDAPEENAAREELEFETKYDEIKYLHDKGRISDEEYERQMKQLIN